MRRDRMSWKIAKTIAEIVIIAIIIYVAVWLYTSLGFASAEITYTEAYILCEDYVNVRVSANKKQDPIGRLEAGDMVLTDGRKKNGYVHCVDLTFEYSEGWVNAGFLVYDKPEKMNRTATIVSKGRLAARKYVGGKRTRWLKSGATVRIWYWSDEWCLTNCGYVKTEFLELDGE